MFNRQVVKPVLNVKSTKTPNPSSAARKLASGSESLSGTCCNRSGVKSTSPDLIGLDEVGRGGCSRANGSDGQCLIN